MNTILSFLLLFTPHIFHIDTHSLLEELFQAVDVRSVSSLPLHDHAVSVGKGEGSKAWGHQAKVIAFNNTVRQSPEPQQRSWKCKWSLCQSQSVVHILIELEV